MQRPALLAALGAAALAALYLAFAVRSPVSLGFFGDDAVYATTAKALAEGRGYRHLSIPGEPLQTKYPPLYPALLSLVIRAFPDRGGGPDLLGDFRWLLAPTALAGAGAVVLAALYWHRILGASGRLTVAVAALAALSPAWLAFTRVAMSELLYALLATAALLCLDQPRAARGGSPRHREAPARRCAGGMRRAHAHDRRLARDRRRRDAPAPAPPLGRAADRGGDPRLCRPLVELPEPPPRSRTARAAASFLVALRARLLRLASGRPAGGAARRRAESAAPLLRPRLLPARAARGLRARGDRRGRRSPACCSTPSATPRSCSRVWGFWLSARSGIRTLHLYAAIYGGIILLWTFSPYRFLVPWTPFLIFFAATGLRAVLRARWLARIAYAAVLALFLAEDWKLARSTERDYFAREVAIDWEELRDVERFLREHTQPEDVIASSHPERFFLSTGRRGHYFWPVTDPVALDYDPGRAASRFTILPAPAEARARSQEVMRRLAEVYRDAKIAWYVDWAALESARSFSSAARGGARPVRAAPHHSGRRPSRSIGSGFPRAEARKPRASSGAQRSAAHLGACRIDHHARRRREPEPAPVGAAAGAQIEAVAVPRTAQAAVLERRRLPGDPADGGTRSRGRTAPRPARPRENRGRRARP